MPQGLLQWLIDRQTDWALPNVLPLQLVFSCKFTRQVASTRINDGQC